MNEFEIGRFVNSLLEGNKDEESRKLLVTEAKANSDRIRGYILQLIVDHNMRMVIKKGRAIIRDDIQGTINEVIKELLVRTSETPVTATPAELAVVIINNKIITTMPGHHREKLPFSPKGVWEHASDAEKTKLIEKFGSEDEALSRINADFEINAKDWTNAGFIKKR
jgi:hypothetical protein